ncbi:hypothetical protein CIHG_01153 [Coccidioides immitis H538.4]|uniref:Uncharacterized protein n=1 Tax=Coccidioides immitis H538.4 TaxID=396776 RepID=A0A0J8RFH9_COCIT|nr:hypothetical protein CIHG_01153 [Coccidioides immitis H538.4]
MEAHVKPVVCCFTLQHNLLRIKSYNMAPVSPVYTGICREYKDFIAPFQFQRISWINSAFWFGKVCPAEPV